MVPIVVFDTNVIFSAVGWNGTITIHTRLPYVKGKNVRGIEVHNGSGRNHHEDTPVDNP
jgi:hypothetical protein